MSRAWAIGLSCVLVALGCSGSPSTHGGRDGGMDGGGVSDAADGGGPSDAADEGGPSDAGVAGSATYPTCTPMTPWQRALRVWANLYPSLKTRMETELSAGDTLSALYDTQYFLMNFAIRVRRENDVEALSQLCDLASTAPLRWLRNAAGVGQPVPTSWRDITEPLTWADAHPSDGNIDSLNNVVQWMYFVGYLMHSVALVPPASRTATMSRFLDVYSRIFSFDVPAMVFDVSNAMGWDFQGWSNCARVSHEEMTTLKYLGEASTTVDPTAPCNAVLDWDEQLWGAVLEYRAAVALNPAHVNYPDVSGGTVDQRLLGYLRTAYDTVDNHFSWTSLTDFSGAPADGYLFNRGAWTYHPDFRFAGVEHPEPPMSTEASPVPNVGEDMGHHIRLPWVLLSFYENKALVGRTFPTDADMRYYVNQIVYRVFNGDFAAPRFRHFTDGSNGWFRIGLTDGETTTGGPWTGSLAFVLGPFGCYGAFQPSIGSVMDAVAPAFMDSGAGGAAARSSLSSGFVQGCTYSAATDSWTPCSPYPAYFGFGDANGESLAFFSQYGL